MDMDSCVIDLRSDTVTKPTAEMRKAMANAEVGDDVYREDPTVLKFEEYAANLLGKEAGLFVSSGTMGNLISIMCHCWERGCEIIVGEQSHINLYEQGGTAQLAGVFLRSLKTNPDGSFDLEELKSKIRYGDNIHECRTKLICLENTNNRCGGTVLPMSFIEEVCEIARQHDISVHMDGARLLNASVYLGIPAADIVRNCKSVSLCLSKGLGAPVGSVIVGSKDFIQRALRCRKVLGGAMRQVGILAAAGILALQNAEKTLTKDHRHARMFAEAILSLKSPLISVDLEHVQTNIVILNFSSDKLTATKFASLMSEPSSKFSDSVVKVMVWSPVKVRCVFHLDISEKHTIVASEKVAKIIKASEN